MQASLEAGVVKVRTTVDGVRSGSSDLKLHIALVEEQLSYSGESGTRFHPMVVRSLAGGKAAGFALEKSGKTIVTHTFDLKKITAELKAHLEELERERKTTFYRKKHEIDTKGLSVAAFVQDAKSRDVLQAALVKVDR